MASGEIKALFARQIDREINSVVSIDNEHDLRQEFEEYVLTAELKEHMEVLLGSYLGKGGRNAAWISGFYGSGKSHLLKMLSRLLVNAEIPGSGGRHALDYLREAAARFDDDGFFIPDLRKAANIPAESVFFNIISAAPEQPHDDVVLQIFQSKFYEHCGYYTRTAFVAAFERDLDRKGLWEPFQAAYEKKFGESWVLDREILLNYPRADEIYHDLTGEHRPRLLSVYEDSQSERQYSIEDFARDVWSYIEKKSRGNPLFRLNFFVDEVGMFIGDDTARMRSLQEIATKLRDCCHGRSWLFVTAQEDLTGVLGVTGIQQKNDMSKIMDRFQPQIHLDSRNVDEVIRERLLKKTPAATAALTQLYAEHHAALSLSITAQVTLRGQYTLAPQNAAEFCALYPLMPYQISLLQETIGILSDTNRLSGRTHGTGERSLLGVLQAAVVRLANAPAARIGQMVSFDRFYDVLDDVLRTNSRLQVTKAGRENQLEEAEIRILKCLFLLKGNRHAQGTVADLRALLFDDFTASREQAGDAIRQRLERLENQSYIRADNGGYSFLTDDEKLIDEQIRAQKPDSFRKLNLLRDLFFNSKSFGLNGSKGIEHPQTGQAFAFAQYVDGIQVGTKRLGIGINLITFENALPREELRRATARENSPDEQKVMVVADREDQSFADRLDLYLQTEQFCAQFSGETEIQKNIVNDRRKGLDRERHNLEEGTEAWLHRAHVYVCGEESDAWLRPDQTYADGQEPEPGTDPATRIKHAFIKLVEKTYPQKVRQVPAADYLQTACQKPRPDMPPAPLSQEAQVLAASIRQKLGMNKSARYFLTDVLETQRMPPYGWPDDSTLGALAELARQHKIRLVHDEDRNFDVDTNLFACLSKPAYKKLLRVEAAADVAPEQLDFLRSLYRDLTDNRSLKADLAGLRGDLQALFAEWVTFLQIATRGVPPKLTCYRQAGDAIQSLQKLQARPEDFYGRSPAQGASIHDERNRLLAVRDLVTAWHDTDPDSPLKLEAAYSLAQQLRYDQCFKQRAAELLTALQDERAFTRGPACRSVTERYECLQKDAATKLAERQEDCRQRCRNFAADCRGRIEAATTLSEAQRKAVDHAVETYLQDRETEIRGVDTAPGMLQYTANLAESEKALEQKLREIIPPASPAPPNNRPASVYLESLYKVPGFTGLCRPEDVECYLTALRQVLLDTLDQHHDIVI